MENNLLASVALFSELYNNEKYNNLSDILAEFIKQAVVAENKWSITIQELSRLLTEHYGFKIPDAVIKSTVKNRLKNVAQSQNNGIYLFDNNIRGEYANFDEDYDKITIIQNEILNALISFIESREDVVFVDDKKRELISEFNNYLIGNNSNDKYSKYISAFLIKNQKNKVFTENLNLVREGIILYQGIKYSADINELGAWNTDLTIFLSTEHIFNALGYNGLLYQEIFEDFLQLVNEINLSSKSKGGDKKIELKYFEETKDEIDGFFTTAESILKGNRTLDPSKPAMIEILKGCKYPSDIKSKKISFERDLRQKGIVLQEFKQSVYTYTDYVVDDINTIEELRKASLSRGRYFDEELCNYFFRIFTKINYYRGGESKTKFEKIGHIFMTDNRFGLYLAHNTKVKFNDGDIAFAKDIDYLTNKFWFKLKKGFSDKQNLPKSFDVVTKAQLILSSQLNQSIGQAYSTLIQKYSAGTLSKEDALQLNYDLKEKPNKPEDISLENIDNSLNFLNHEIYYEEIFREKQRKDRKLLEYEDEVKALREEIKKREAKESEEKNRILEEQKLRETDIYISENWQIDVRKLNYDALYFIFVLLVTVLPIAIALLLKTIPQLDTWMNGQSNATYWLIYSIIIGIFLFELFGRSYIFKKERVKSGWEWITCCIITRKKHDIKNERRQFWLNQFNSEESNHDM